MRLKSYLLASALCALPVAAQAAPPAVYNWTGFYVGASGGFVSQGTRATDLGDNNGNPFFFPGALGNTYNVSGTGGIFGINGGYNWQMGNFVYGLEVDIAASSLDNTVNVASGYAISSKLNSLGTIRGRLGYAFDRALVYATGGFAYGHVDNNSYFIAFPTFHAGTSGMQTGWTLGGGGEYAVTNRWTIRVEGLYVDLGNKTGITNPTNTCRIGYKNTYGVGRLGANFRF